jgi:hypothetical protein
MRRRSAVRVAVVVCCLLGSVAVLAGPVAAADIEIENTLSQSESAGQIDVETRLSVPDSVVELEVVLPAEAAVYESSGFRQVDDRTYEWTETTAEPSLSYEYEGTVRGTRGDREGVFFVVADEWALVRTPTISVSGETTADDTEIVRENAVEGEGVASTHMAYLGAYSEYTGAAAGQEFRLVVPEAADLREEPAEILETLEGAAERLSIGEPTEGVFVVAAPTGEHTWASAGLQRGDGGDMWVRDVERLGTPSDTWIHEYVHTRQRYAQLEARRDSTAPETRWTIEGMAEYYAALLPYEAGAITYEEFRDRLEEGAAAEYDDVRLAEPATWTETGANYDRGALVFAHIDRRLRAEHGTTLDAVVASINDRDAELTQEEFLDAIEAAGGAEIRQETKQYTETTETPPIATKREHVAAFGGPDVRYAIENASVSGPYRAGPLEEGASLVVGESIELNVTAENVGSDPGAYETELRVDGEPASVESGELEAGESARFRVAHAFETAGEFDVTIGSERRTVTVEQPAEIEVTALAAEPTDPAPGSTVTLRATVESAADRPAEGEVRFAVDGDTVATEPVRIGGGAETVTTTVTFEEPGEYAVSAGGRSVTVSVVDEGTETDSGSSETGTDGAGTETDSTGADPGESPPLPDQPGPGPAVAALAVLLGLVASGRRL